MGEKNERNYYIGKKHSIDSHNINNINIGYFNKNNDSNKDDSKKEFIDKIISSITIDTKLKKYLNNFKSHSMNIFKNIDIIYILK